MARPTWAWSPTQLRAIRGVAAHLKRGDCHGALMAYRRLPTALRYSDRLGPLKAQINRCHRVHG
jgi:hypothetical protein